VPLVLCALAGLFAERSGLVDIGLEGKMLAGAFAAACTAYWLQSPWLGLAVAIAVGCAFAMAQAFACITHRGNQVVTGMAINVLAAGLTVVLAYAWFNEGGNSPALPDALRFRPIELPFASALAGVPYLGRFYSGLLSGHNALVYLTVLLVPAVSFVVFRTRFGLRLRAVGENPHAVDTAGISVAWLRYRAMLACGVLCGTAGAYLAIAQSASCLLFAFADAAQGRLQGVSLPWIGVVPIQAIQALPYILTVLLLAGFVGKAVAPKASGIAYVKEK
jgi:simple sugar transport system permease protein